MVFAGFDSLPPASIGRLKNLFGRNYKMENNKMETNQRIKPLSLSERRFATDNYHLINTFLMMRICRKTVALKLCLICTCAVQSIHISGSGKHRKDVPDLALISVLMKWGIMLENQWVAEKIFQC